MNPTQNVVNANNFPSIIFGKVLNTFKVKVPFNYDARIQTNRFVQIAKAVSYDWDLDGRLTSEHFASLQHLKPSKTYSVSFISITGIATYEMCVEFLETNGAVLVGAEGLIIFHEQYRDLFPSEKWIFSPSEQPGNESTILSIRSRYEGGWTCDLVEHTTCFDSNFVLLAFFED